MRAKRIVSYVMMYLVEFMAHRPETAVESWLTEIKEMEVCEEWILGECIIFKKLIFVYRGIFGAIHLLFLMNWSRFAL